MEDLGDNFEKGKKKAEEGKTSIKSCAKESMKSADWATVYGMH